MVVVENDVALGRVLLEQWATFAEHAGFPAPSGGADVGAAGAIGWRAVDDTPGWPGHYVHGVIGAAGETASVVDHKAAVCRAWRNASVGQQWWWIN